MDDYDIFMNSSDTESTYSDYFETKDFKRLVPAENFKGGSNIMRYSAIIYGILTFMCLGDAIQRLNKDDKIYYFYDDPTSTSLFMIVRNYFLFFKICVTSISILGIIILWLIGTSYSAR